MVLVLQALNRGGLATAHWLESMEMPKMSLILNGFVNKINEHIKNVIDFKWFL